MQKALEIFRVIFIAHNQSAKVKQPGKQPLDFPASNVAAQRPSVLGLGSLGPIGRNHFCAVVVHQLSIQSVTVISFITNQTFRDIGHDPFFHRRFDQLHFSRRSTFCPQGERKTMAVCDAHDLGALTAFGLSDQAPPFLAGTNVPSTKHSFKSNPPASLRCSAKASSTCSTVPSRTQFWKRRCTVWYGPYRGGKSCHGAPVLKIQSAPSSALRRSLQGRPRPSARTRSTGKIASIIVHCSSVKSIHQRCTLTLKVQEFVYEMASSYHWPTFMISHSHVQSPLHL